MFHAGITTCRPGIFLHHALYSHVFKLVFRSVSPLLHTTHFYRFPFHVFSFYRGFIFFAYCLCRILYFLPRACPIYLPRLATCISVNLDNVPYPRLLFLIQAFSLAVINYILKDREDFQCLGNARFMS